MPPHPGRIGVLNGLRGAAILAVVYHHFYARWTPPGWLAIKLAGLTVHPATYLANGWIGVNLFFVLSGFVLYLPYAQGRRRMAGLGDVVGFYKHRMRRLLPLYAISTLILDMLVVRPDYGSLSCWKYYAVMGTCTFPFFRGTFFPRMNLVLWTLGIEIWFSVLFPLLILAIGRFGLRRVVVAALAIGLATRFVGTSPRFLIPLYTYNYVKDSIFGRLDDFVLGMATCAVFVRGLPTRSARPRVWFFAGIFLLTLGCWAWDAVRLGQSPVWAQPLYHNLINIGASLVTLGLLYSGPGIIRWIANSTALQIPGLMCYSLYIWHHQPFMLAFPESGPPPGPAKLAGFLVVMIVLSALSYRYIEFGSEPDVKKLFRVGRDS